MCQIFPFFYPKLSQCANERRVYPLKSIFTVISTTKLNIYYLYTQYTILCAVLVLYYFCSRTGPCYVRGGTWQGLCVWDKLGDYAQTGLNWIDRRKKIVSCG